MIPKSTTKLTEGDFCWIEREDGQYVPFIFLQSQSNSRSYFYGGLANHSTKEKKIEELGNNIHPIARTKQIKKETTGANLRESKRG